MIDRKTGTEVHEYKCEHTVVSITSNSGDIAVFEAAVAYLKSKEEYQYLAELCLNQDDEDNNTLILYLRDKSKWDL
mgnify:CR=1 FL=1